MVLLTSSLHRKPSSFNTVQCYIVVAKNYCSTTYSSYMGLGKEGHTLKTEYSRGWVLEGGWVLVVTGCSFYVFCTILVLYPKPIPVAPTTHSLKSGSIVNASACKLCFTTHFYREWQSLTSTMPTSALLALKWPKHCKWQILQHSCIWPESNCWP